MLGREGEFEAACRLLGEPCFGLLGDMGGMIVEDDVDRRVGRIDIIETLKERDDSRLRWRSSTMALTLPVTRSMPASRVRCMAFVFMVAVKVA